MDKTEVANVLDEIGTLLELQGENAFRCNAYHNAARAIQQLETNIADVVEQGRLTEIPGIGETLRDKITSLDSSVSSVGHGLATKKKALLKSKTTAANLDEAIDTLQACLRVLDLVHRISELVKEGRYWSALRVRCTQIPNVLY